jgi:hypothetical protein
MFPISCTDVKVYQLLKNPFNKIGNQCTETNIHHKIKQ